MVEFLKSAEWSRAVFLVSGDTGFYSAATGALRAFEEQGWEVELVPGISCLSWFAARLGRSYQDLAVLSCHGRDTDRRYGSGNMRPRFCFWAERPGCGSFARA